GENFVIWKTQLKSQITGMGKAFRGVNGHVTALVELTLPDKANNAAKAVHKKALEEYNELLNEWEQNNEKIHTLFFATIHQTHKIRIANHLSARESWNELCKRYEHQGELHAQSLVDRMHQLKRPESERNPHPTLNELNLLIADHASAGGTGNYLFAFSATVHVATDFTRLEEMGIVSCSFTALLDSGANQHYYPNRDRFSELHTIKPIAIHSANNLTFYANAHRKVPIT
ncbi:hypothetical protein K438DRAFT_1430854, partial [Mycena galopus ATCC 62051]